MKGNGRPRSLSNQLTAFHSAHRTPEKQRDFTLRREILLESRTATRDEVSRKKRAIVELHRSIDLAYCTGLRVVESASRRNLAQRSVCFRAIQATSPNVWSWPDSVSFSCYSAHEPYELNWIAACGHRADMRFVLMFGIASPGTTLRTRQWPWRRPRRRTDAHLR